MTNKLIGQNYTTPDLVAKVTGQAKYAEDYRARHDLPSPSHIQRAVGALAKEEVVGRDADGVYRIVEPFLAEWIRQDQAGYDLVRQLRPRRRRS